MNVRARIALAALAGLALVPACDEGGGSDPDLDAGAGADADGDADADADTDTDIDTGADTDGGEFAITSPAFADGDILPVQYSCDGAGGGTSPPLDWIGVPSGTAELALMVTTMAVDGLKWNWVRYAIPGDATGLPEGGGDLGTDGLTSDGPLLKYYPPCPHGPGFKSYDFTLHALSATPELVVPADEVTGQVLTDAIAGITLNSCTITVLYEEIDPDGGT